MKEATKVFMQALLDGAKLEYLNDETGLWLENRSPLSALLRYETGCLQLRVAPKTIFIGDKELPGPCVEAPEHGKIYWYITLRHPHQAETSKWENHVVDRGYLQSGNVFKTQEDAEAAAEHLVSLLTQNHPKTESNQ